LVLIFKHSHFPKALPLIQAIQGGREFTASIIEIMGRITYSWANSCDDLMDPALVDCGGSLSSRLKRLQKELKVIKDSLRLVITASIALTTISSSVTTGFAKDFGESVKVSEVGEPGKVGEAGELGRKGEKNQCDSVEQFSKRKIAMTSTNSAGTGFALGLFSRTNKEKKNVLISPFSAYVCLSMVLNGAAGNTLSKVLGATSGLAELNKKNESLKSSLSSSLGVQLKIANAIFGNKGTFKKEFVSVCQEVYGAEAHTEPFSNKTVEIINAWCNEKTNGKISKILDQLDPNEKMVLINAIYYKGGWLNQFKTTNTVDDKFTLDNGEQQPVKMMHHFQKGFSYFKGDKFSSIALPYKGENQAMYIFLPDPEVKLSALQAEFNEANWKSWMSSFKRENVNVSLPKFKIEYSTRLNDSLKSMGMTDAFSEGVADFSKMCDEASWLSRVLQKTFMDVNEEGTEAAAVTAAVMMSRSISMQPPKIIEFRVDRPFILALVDNESGEILFIGSVYEPR